MSSSSDLAISVRGISKSYTISHDIERASTFAETVVNRLRHPFQQMKKETFWALSNVSFDVKKGEVVGIIGRNGAGKSTLLKILSRITEPTDGEIDLYGRVASLLEVGTGFHPELSGRENVYVNGAILGMTKREIRAQFDAIADFAEVEAFLDTPVKRYSSGMYVRLAFAVAAHLSPEILVVDEVLAVGDAQFQKMHGKISEVAKHGRTVLFVSHNMGAIANLCSRAVYLAEGSVIADGPSAQVISRYIETGKQSTGETIWSEPGSAPSNSKLRLDAIRIVSCGETTADVNISKEVEVQVDFSTLTSDLCVSTSIHLLDRMGTCILATGNLASATTVPDPWFNRPHPAGHFRAVCRFPANFLNEGLYHISAYLLTDVRNIEVQAAEAVSFTVHETGEMRKEYSGAWIGMIRPKLPWLTELLDCKAYPKVEKVAS